MSHDQIGTTAAPLDPLLGTLQNNGGPTFTRALLMGSPAIDKGKRDTIAGLTTMVDQRGMARPFDVLNLPNAMGGDGSDIGAFEFATASLGNLSTRLNVGMGERALIGGFIIIGTDTQMVLVRGLGPSLAASGVQSPLADPVLEVYSSTGALVSMNDNWKDTQQAAIQGTMLAPTNDAEAAVLLTLGPGQYTAILRGKNNTTGVGLFELYGLQPNSAAQFGNLSARGFVNTGENVLIGGLIVQGTNNASVLFRALGPSLSSGGVSQPLANPMIEVFNGQGMKIAENDNWKDTQQAAIQATGIPPTNDNESAVIVSLAAGNYTGVVRGVNNTTGVALVESYRLQ